MPITQMPPRPKATKMTAEDFCEAHGDTFVKWLQENAVACACDDRYGCDQTKQHGKIPICVETDITCRRCFLPIGLHSVSLRAPLPGPAPPRAARCLPGPLCPHPAA